MKGKNTSDFPVENVSWEEADEFCKKLTARIGERGRKYRLPTEAEWECACRAGTTTDFHFGDVPNTDLANYDGSHSWNGSPVGQYRNETTEVGSFPPNPWGLFDLHGNVWEWCADVYGAYGRGDATDPQRELNRPDDYRAGKKSAEIAPRKRRRALRRARC